MEIIIPRSVSEILVRGSHTNIYEGYSTKISTNIVTSISNMHANVYRMQLEAGFCMQWNEELTRQGAASILRHAV